MHSCPTVPLEAQRRHDLRAVGETPFRSFDPKKLAASVEDLSDTQRARIRAVATVSARRASAKRNSVGLFSGVLKSRSADSLLAAAGTSADDVKATGSTCSVNSTPLMRVFSRDQSEPPSANVCDVSNPFSCLPRLNVRSVGVAKALDEVDTPLRDVISRSFTPPSTHRAAHSASVATDSAYLSDSTILENESETGQLGSQGAHDCESEKCRTALKNIQVRKRLFSFSHGLTTKTAFRYLM